MKRLTCKGLAFFLFLLALSPISAPAASAANPTVYESMSGTDGANMTGTASSDSVGLTGNWTVVNAFKKPNLSTSLSPLYKNRFNSYLAFPTNVRWKLPSSNTAASTAPELYSLYYAQRQLSAGINFDSASINYFSFLDYVPNIGGNSGSAVIGLLNGLPSSSSDSSSNSILMGRSYANAPTIQITPANNAAWNNTPYTATGTGNNGFDASGNSWFVIAKITTVATGNDTIALKFFASTDTVPASDASIAWDVSYSAAITGTYSYLAVQTESDGTIDELRGGATYDVVSGVAIAPTISAPVISGVAYKGVNTTASLTSVATGTFRFFLDGKRVPACLSKPTSGTYPNYTATCTWKPPVVGTHRLTATFSSSDSAYTNSTSPTATIAVLARSGNR